MSFQDHRPRAEDRRGYAASAEARYASLFNNVPIGLYITTPEGLIVDANPALVAMLGYPDKASLLGIRTADLYLDPTDRDREESLFGEAPIVENYATQLRRHDGETIWVRDTCRAVRGEDGEVVSYEGSLQDITAERHAQKELVYMARHDPLTGLYNRHTLRSILQSEVGRARRYKHPIGVLMIDVNHLKETNDRFGHAAGDTVLKIVADVLVKTVRESDVVVRYGGDEFLVLLVETDGETEIVRDRIRLGLSERMHLESLLDLPTSLAIGIAHWMPETGQSIEHVLSEADRAMYDEKRKHHANHRENGSL
jgi:diguanylate cyclase (GGDEF)-like protein/PAS domain S-box-containing protein